MKISSAQIVCVGTELLLGDIVNTNEAYIAARLRELGVPLRHSLRLIMGCNEETGMKDME